jgi:replication factor C subunit 2/4
MSSEKPSNPWIDKHRPKKIKDIVQQEDIIETLENTKKTGQLPHLLFYGPPGTGKCLGGEVEVLLYNGKIKKAKHITDIDILVGDDGYPRYICNTTKGKDNMFKIIQEYGDDYIVNSVHVLSLILVADYIIEIINDKYYLWWFENHNIKYEIFEERIFLDIKINNLENIRNKKYDICDIPLNEYLKKSEMWKRFYKGFKAKKISQLSESYISKYFINNKYSTNDESLAEKLIYMARCQGFIVNIDIIEDIFYLKLIDWEPYRIKIEKIGFGDYYGFELTGNGRFLLADFTVTHNTSTILALCNELFGSKMKERILELNASDARGIDVVRNKIIQFAKFSVNDDDGLPPYKIIILDEADAMTTEAQSALRKVMEEESGTTRFCLICNYLNQIIKPIISRCSKFRFKPISSENMEKKLKYISEKEDVILDHDLIKKISKLSNGDIRKGIMSLQYLKYYKKYKKIELDDIYNITGTVNPIVTDSLWDVLIGDNKIGHIIKQVENIITSGYNVISLYEQLKDKIKDSDLDDIKKSLMILHLSSSEKKLSEGADEYIQLMSVFSYISGVNKNYYKEQIDDLSL